MNNPQVENNNVSYEDKVMLRLTAVRQLGCAPVVLEAYGGEGDVWSACYRQVADGVVFEKRPDRAIHLAHQRPTWAVYECDCVPAVAHGAGCHLTVNLLDVDPYGDAWPLINAFFGSQRPFADRMFVVVNDGLRQNTRVNGAWRVGTLQPVVQQWGNDLWDKYLEACELLMGEAAALGGYRVVFFDGYYTGHEKNRCHYLAELHKG